ncbi:ATP-binding protein [Variovorax sp. H27-G14]|uniref:ATP-binding protein n=1 Tax=Variovorax sp. H27-G14 TaxID=3111914 RepID=UPI0038FC6D2C
MTARRWLVAALWLCTVASAQPPESAPPLNAEERAWVAGHPVVRMAVQLDTAPIQFMQNGKLRGLTAEFLKVMAQKSGLTFHYVQVNSVQAGEDLLRQGQVDLLGVVRAANGPQEEQGLHYARPRKIHVLLVIARSGARLVSDAGGLNGKTIGTPLHPYYEADLRAKLPDSKVLQYASMLPLLTALTDGTVDAVLATELYLTPYIHRRFKGVLQISGALSEYSSVNTLAVRADQPILASVVQKSLDAITDQEGAEIYTRWLATDAFDAPSLSVLTKHYLAEFALLTLVLLLLSGLVYQMHRQRRKSVHGEREKTRFLAVMSHEIRSPMNAILAAIELLRQTPLNKAQRHLADLADSGGDALLGLLDDVLDFSRLEANQLKLACKPTDVGALVHRVAEQHRASANAKNIALTVDAVAGACWLQLDEARVAQVLRNLISNAIKFTEAGRVDVHVSASPSDVRGHMHLSIAVVDTGIGIALQSRARLFQPYAQAANTYSRSGGTGLGLAVCGKLAALMHGAISLDSEPGKGSTVTLSLLAETATATPDSQLLSNDDHSASPLAHVEQAAPEPHHEKPGAGVRILLVEDTPANQEAIGAQLQGLGCQLAVAADGAQALALFASAPFDLVLMDCDLPDQDGYTLATEMRRREAQPTHTEPMQMRVPILAISASTGTAHAERCFDAGMDGVLSKPIRLAKLRNAIELWCEVDLEQPDGAADPAAPIDELPHVREAIDKDVRDLLRAVALRDADSALRASHRLHGAALTLGWPEIAQAAGTVEALLRAQAPWRSDDYAALLARLVQGATSTALPALSLQGPPS